MRFGRTTDEALVVLGESEHEADERERSPARAITAKAFYALAAVLCLWVFAYGSGLFPYLGSGELEDHHAPPFKGAPGYNMGFGTSTMLLFRGQTAFYEYDSTSPQGEITFDVKPITVLGYSERMERVKGVAKGRIEFPITATGLYKFEHGPALARPYGTTAYSVSWGAS
jgi:hypothetical protein